MMTRYISSRIKPLRFLTALVGLILVVVSMGLQSAYADDCSPYIGAMTINEVYELGGESWVEVRLLDTSLSSSLYNQWSLQVCSKRDPCGTYSLSSGEVLYPDTFPAWITIDVDSQDVDLQKNGGMEVLLLDENGYVIDYLSVNNLYSQQP
ncbi:MAG: biosis protein MshQ, partial [Desulfuromonadales bacterium]|nr:biosis protein MshQ [Desulfuromonadales bacterium]